MLNDRAREILSFIKRFSSEKGFPPTIREIGEAFGISSTNGVRYYLTMLEKSGQLTRRGKISRGIGLVAPSLVPTPAQVRRTAIPILGQVAAGQPTLAEESFEGSIEPESMFGDPAGTFALRVRGDSMIDAGILEDDYVIVRHQERANAGEIIVALVEDEATVKYFQPRRGTIELVAANPKYSPIVVSPKSGFRILGVVRGVIRTIGR
jgi:repressor LexA